MLSVKHNSNYFSPIICHPHESPLLSELQGPLNKLFSTHDLLPIYEVSLLATSEFKIMHENKAYLEFLNQFFNSFSNAARRPVRNIGEVHWGHHLLACT